MGQKTKTIIAVTAVVLVSVLIFFRTGYGFVKPEAEEEPDSTGPRLLSSEVWVTAYSSSPDETDDTPFVTASGETVADGIVAANFLPLYSTIQIPEVFGDRVFIVKDRMHSRKTNFVDVWMPSKEKAKEFGIHQTEILIVHIPQSELTLVK